MYEAWFGLTRRPFSAVPQPDEYYPGAAVEAARQTLLRCIQRGEGAAVVIGPSGTGKTLLCHLLAEHFRHDFHVVLLARGPFDTRRALLQTILHELGQPFRGMDEAELRLALADHLAPSDECRHGMLLLVDEAHGFPLRVLEEIRTLTNLTAAGEPRVRLVLAGNAALEERLASPKLESFGQRIVARCYLEAFNRTETEEYIGAQIRAAGGTPEAVFPVDACLHVYRATDGVPRLVNQVCDHALLLAYANQQRQLEPACVDEAWADLQQLPTPWNGDKAVDGSRAEVIEFGSLDGDEADAPAAQASPDTPLLRVAEHDDSPAVEPVEQLQRIENTLAELEDDFRPAGSVGPEVELVFSDPSDPFSEHFDEVETVVERYTGAAQPGLGPLATVPAPVPSVVPHVALSRTASPAAAAVQLATIERVRPLHVPEPLAATVPLRREPAPDAAHADDAELITIEDNCDEMPVAVRPVVPIRQREYRRLFARLRQG